MYIRTECGLIRNVDEIEISGAYYKPVTGFEYGIVKRGDNLIDVLDLDDIIEFNDPRYTNEVYRITSFITSIGNHFTGIKFIETNDDYNFNETDLSGLNIKVITHEQYMKLAQEVK
jgi:hypothetical protein